MLQASTFSANFCTPVHVKLGGQRKALGQGVPRLSAVEVTRQGKWLGVVEMTLPPPLPIPASVTFTHERSAKC